MKDKGNKSYRIITFKFFLISIGVLSVLFMLAVYYVYFFNFSGPLSERQDVWGAFGDFVGGALNSFFSFLSFMALLVTIYMQNKEIRISNNELIATREELELSRKATERQAKHFDTQGKKEDYQKVIDILDKELSVLIGSELPESILEASTVAVLSTIGVGGKYIKQEKMTFSEMLDSDVGRLPSKKDGFREKDEKKYLALIKEISNILGQLSTHLTSYKREFGKSIYFFHFRTKYKKLAKFLVKNKHTSIENVKVLIAESI